MMEECEADVDQKSLSLLLVFALLIGAFACLRPLSARADTDYIVILDPGEGTGSTAVCKSSRQGIKPNEDSAGSNDFYYKEPPFHEEGLDNPDKPASVVLSDEQLLDYLSRIEQKTYDYLDSLTDEMLCECPENCEHTRMELILRQFRHISFHTGMLNGQTAVATGKFPMWVSQADKYVDDGILFGRYRKGQVTK